LVGKDGVLTGMIQRIVNAALLSIWTQLFSILNLVFSAYAAAAATRSA
jgi:hypothetical protein